jgi:hypothetical protein
VILIIAVWRYTAVMNAAFDSRTLAEKRRDKAVTWLFEYARKAHAEGRDEAAEALRDAATVIALDHDLVCSGEPHGV